MPLALEGIGGQPHAARFCLGERRRPVHLRPPDVPLRQRGQEARRTALVALQGGNDRRPLELSQDGVGGLLGAVAQHRMRADLDEGPPPFPQESLDCRLEEHRLAQVVEPVLGAHLGGVGGLAGDGRVDGDLARLVARSRRARATNSSRAPLDLR